MSGESQLVGAAGQYYVGYKLSEWGLTAAQTIGNSIGVDLLVCDDKGLNPCSIQVKTAKNAYRNNRYGRAGYEFDVGSSVIGKQSTSLWYVFVDLNMDKDEYYHPKCFVVPSKWVAEFVKPDFTRKIFFLTTEAAALCEEKFDFIRDCNNEDIKKFATTWPDQMVRWGN